MDPGSPLLIRRFGETGTTHAAGEIQRAIIARQMVGRSPSALAWGPARRGAVAGWERGGRSDPRVRGPAGPVVRACVPASRLGRRRRGRGARRVLSLERRRSRGDRRTGRLARQGGHELVPEPDVGGPRAARGLRRALAARAGADRRWRAWAA